jgi:hypothetical protein
MSSPKAFELHAKLKSDIYLYNLEKSNSKQIISGVGYTAAFSGFKLKEIQRRCVLRISLKKSTA